MTRSAQGPSPQFRDRPRDETRGFSDDLGLARSSHNPRDMTIVDEVPGVDRTGCPLLMPTRHLGHDEIAIGRYCRFPNGRVRVPARDEMLTYCSVRAWDRCPVYRRYGQPA